MAHAVSGECENPYSDYFGEVYLDKNGKIVPGFGKQLHSECKYLLSLMYKVLENATINDNSIYSGLAGLGLLHYLLFDRLDNRGKDRFLQQAISFLDQPLNHLNKGETTFLSGDGGPLAVAAVIFNHLGNTAKSKECIKCLLGYYNSMCSEKESTDEVIFGRVGYLFALLYLQSELGSEVVDQEFIRILYRNIVLTGQKTTKRHAWMNSPLLWEWHGKIYLGAAHGVAGVLYVLMQVSDPSCKNLLEQYVKPTVDTLLALRNCPSGASGQHGDLVSWCNGAPGWTYMFVQAHKLFGDKKYLKEAENCADVIWQRGLLQRAHSLCHGITGNAYSFLVIFRHTGNHKYLYRACRFAESCFDHKKYSSELNVNTLSLFEGIAGTVYFMCDILDPKRSKFPGFDL